MGALSANMSTTTVPHDVLMVATYFLVLSIVIGGAAANV